jgi:hypothetical protein
MLLMLGLFAVGLAGWCLGVVGNKAVLLHVTAVREWEILLSANALTARCYWCEQLATSVSTWYCVDSAAKIECDSLDDFSGCGPLWCGFGLVDFDPPQPNTERKLIYWHLREFAVPSWFCVACPLVCFASWLRAKRAGTAHREPGFCHKCGYDLRASKDRCPECGTPIPPPRDLKPPGA